MKPTLSGSLVPLIIFFTLFSVSAQRKVNMVEVIDKLRYEWDATAIALKDYQGIQNFCASDQYKKETLELLDEIHHWDTALYIVVKAKYANTRDKEAEATLRDIETLETDYTTLKFKNFILEECAKIENIKSDFDEMTIKEYEKGIKNFEKELVNYLNIITNRIDIVDEHMHHLKLE